MDIKKLAAQAAATGSDLSKPKTGGGSYEAPAEGLCGLRLVSYIEIGEHTKKKMGEDVVQNMAVFVFEVSGSKWPAKNGEPLRLTVEAPISDHEKSNYVKLFKKLNYANKYTHFAEIVADDTAAFRGRIKHRTFKMKSGQDGVAPELYGKDDGWRIMPPVAEVMNEETGETEERPITVAPALSTRKLFIWQLASKEMWDSLYIAGEFPAFKDEKTGAERPAKSKNVLQTKIKSALNWEGSPMQQILANGGEPDLGKADKPADKPARTRKPRDEKPKAEAKADTQTPPAEDDDDPLGDLGDDIPL